MEQKTQNLCPSAPLERDIYLEQRLENKLNVVTSFNNHISNIKEVLTYSKDRNNKSKKKYKKYKTLTTILKFSVTFVIFVTTSSSITLSFTGFALIVIPIATASAYSLSFFQ